MKKTNAEIIDGLKAVGLASKGDAKGNFETVATRYQTEKAGRYNVRIPVAGMLNFFNNRAKDISTLTGKKVTANDVAEKAIKAASLKVFVKTYKSDANDAKVNAVAGLMVRSLKTNFHLDSDFTASQKEVFEVLQAFAKAFKGTPVRVIKKKVDEKPVDTTMRVNAPAQSQSVSASA